MSRYFNTEGLCDPDIHYMVNLDDRLRRIKRFFVDRGKYFVINRGRQYGKTTTLRALASYLQEDYFVISMDFQLMSTGDFEEEKEFTAKAGGGAVEVTISGKKEIVKVKLSEEVVDPNDIEMLEDLIVAATNEALRQVEEASQASMAKLTGGLGGLGSGFPF